MLDIIVMLLFLFLWAAAVVASLVCARDAVIKYKTDREKQRAWLDLDEDAYGEP